jgi:hypothetical protein
LTDNKLVSLPNNSFFFSLGRQCCPLFTIYFLDVYGINFGILENSQTQPIPKQCLGLCYKTFTGVINTAKLKDFAFVIAGHFHPSLMFANPTWYKSD